MIVKEAIRAVLKTKAVSNLRSLKRQAELAQILRSWGLSDPQLISNDTFTSNVYKVRRQDGTLAVLKHFRGTESRINEASGATLLEYYDSKGAVEVLRHNRYAVLLEHIDGEDLSRLVSMKRYGEASDVVCRLIQTLHADRGKKYPDTLKPLSSQFSRILRAKKSSNNSFVLGAREVLVDLLETTERPIPLHADMRSENTMYSRDRGTWIAIDPKGVLGDGCYDVACAFPFQRPCVMSDIDRVTDLTSKFADRLGYPSERIAKFAFVNYANLSTYSGIPEERRSAHRAIAASFRKQF